MTHIVFKEFSFDSAHRLPNVPVGHKCGRLHGHTFKVTIRVKGTVGADTGWVIDYAEISAAFASIMEALDHRFLNDVIGLENPTSENIARWIYERLSIAGLKSVEVRETCTAGCVYCGPSGCEDGD